jgi:hypothetical protein
MITRHRGVGRSRALATFGHAAHDLGLAAWFGGASMGAVGLNTATREVDDPTQRIRVANAGWFRWAPLTALAIGAHLVGVVLTARESGTALLGRDDLLATLRSVATGVAIGATIESGRSGRQVIAGGDVPTATAVVPISDTPTDVAAAMRRLRVVQWIMPLATGAVWILNAAQAARRV